jgi:hypothetical protein
MCEGGVSFCLAVCHSRSWLRGKILMASFVHLRAGDPGVQGARFPSNTFVTQSEDNYSRVRRGRFKTFQMNTRVNSLVTSVWFMAAVLYHRCTTNEGSVIIQYKCPVPIFVLPEMKLRSLLISKTEL